MLAVVLFVGCLVACAAALNLGQFLDADAVVVWAGAATAAVWAAAVAVVWVAAFAVVRAAAAVDGE